MPSCIMSPILAYTADCHISLFCVEKKGPKFEAEQKITQVCLFCTQMPGLRCLYTARMAAQHQRLFQIIWTYILLQIPFFQPCIFNQAFCLCLQMETMFSNQSSSRRRKNYAARQNTPECTKAFFPCWNWFLHQAYF